MDIYKVTNRINGKMYIGCTKSFKDRVTYHKERYGKKKEFSKPLYVAMRKYGVDNFDFTLLQTDLGVEEAYKVEADMIKRLHTLISENGYNVSPGVYFYNVRGSHVNTALLAASDVKDIIKRREAGEKSSSVFKTYENRISWSGFQQIWRGKNWTYLKGQDNVEIIKGNSKLSLKNVRDIKRSFKEGKTASEVAKMYDICYHTAYNIKTGISYKSIVV